MVDYTAFRRKWKGRDVEIDTLVSMFGDAGDAVPPIVVHGPTGTGKTRLLQGLMEGLSLPYAFVACAECYSQRLLFEAIEVQLSAAAPN